MIFKVAILDSVESFLALSSYFSLELVVLFNVSPATIHINDFILFCWCVVIPAGSSPLLCFRSSMLLYWLFTHATTLPIEMCSSLCFKMILLASRDSFTTFFETIIEKAEERGDDGKPKNWLFFNNCCRLEMKFTWNLKVLAFNLRLIEERVW